MKKRYGREVRSYLAFAAVCMAILILFGILNFIYTNNSIAAGIPVAIGILIFSAAIVAEILRYKKNITLIERGIADGEVNEVMLINSVPLASVSAHADATVKWYNEKFSQLFENREMHGSELDAIIPGIKWNDIIRSGKGKKQKVFLCGRQYELISNLVKEKNSKNEEEYTIYLYLLDKTEQLKAIKDREDERTDVAVICIDNYDEIFQRMTDNDQQKISVFISSALSDWAGESKSVLKKIDRDRYYVFFEHQYLQHYIDNKFEILEKIRKEGEKVRQPVSISIGIGTGEHIDENEQAARTALEMAQGRGGDQVGIKDDTQYHFYGAKTREYEKSTRVKTRAVAAALADYIKNSDKVIFVGHKNADYDCFGAAMGLQRAVRVFGKKPYIVYDAKYIAVKKLYEEVIKHSEYEDMFILPEDAQEIMTKNTLVVVLDTHRPNMLQSAETVKKAQKVVLIDHHRRSTDFISNCSLIYHEPYASSTCEMVTEILQYMSIGSAVSALEAECLYTGILLDTKNFIVKTGVRTFEAASYLRRLGLNTIDVKKLFNVDKADYDRRAEIVKTAVEVAPNYSVAYTRHSIPNIRVIASQAADEMLNINSVHASFVIFPDEGKTCVSARSVGNENVHLIMEALGGGGHATVAGVQRADVTIDEMKDMLKEAILNYIKNK